MLIFKEVNYCCLEILACRDFFFYIQCSDGLWLIVAENGSYDLHSSYLENGLHLIIISISKIFRLYQEISELNLNILALQLAAIDILNCSTLFD